MGIGEGPESERRALKQCAARRVATALCGPTWPSERWLAWMRERGDWCREVSPSAAVPSDPAEDRWLWRAPCRESHDADRRVPACRTASRMVDGSGLTLERPNPLPPRRPSSFWPPDQPSSSPERQPTSLPLCRCPRRASQPERRLFSTASPHFFSCFRYPNSQQVLAILMRGRRSECHPGGFARPSRMTEVRRGEREPWPRGSARESCLRRGSA